MSRNVLLVAGSSALSTRVALAAEAYIAAEDAHAARVATTREAFNTGLPAVVAAQAAEESAAKLLGETHEALRVALGRSEEP